MCVHLHFAISGENVQANLATVDASCDLLILHFILPAMHLLQSIWVLYLLVVR